MSKNIVMGMRDGWGSSVPFGISTTDRRHHLYVIGKSGTGKTTLLRNMILQDIEAGRGAAVIDPHGDLAADILDHIPRRRADDVVYFDPSDREFPVGFNLLEKVPPARRHLVASGVVSVFRSLWPDFWGPRLEHFLYATVAALLDCENVSLMGVPRMLTDEVYRAWVVKQVKDPMVRAFWQNEFAGYDKRFLHEAIAPVLNKVGQLLMAPELRHIVGQVRNRVDVREMMDSGHIFIANLSKGKLGEEKVNVLGALWVTQFQLAAMSRADVHETRRRDFYLYVDEFHSFVTDSFRSILSEARKYRLCLTLSHQYLDQLKPDILYAVLGNVGSMVSFRVGPRDATTMEEAYGKSYVAQQFSGLSNGEVIVKLLDQGRDLEPFTGKTHGPAGRRHGRGERFISLSREKYATKREIVERKLSQWLGNSGLL